MLGYCYFPGGVIPQKSNISIKVATSVGTIIGQIAFGALADVVGRKRMYGYELLIIIMSTLGQCLSATATTSTVTITGLMIFWRVIMGIGIGGDYPLSSVIASEYVAPFLTYFVVSFPQSCYDELLSADLQALYWRQMACPKF